ncbi:MAG TPA: chloride channel protein [Methanoregulaceae archaeon]|nr:chloride channel protein [Methanoregulaceae archaeon]
MDEETTSFKKIILIAVIIGVISGFGSLLFFEGLKLATHFFMEVVLGYHLPMDGLSVQDIAAWTPPPHIWLILPVISLGGLLSGILVYTLAPEAAGHGTDAAIKAFHGDGRVRWRIPLLKAVTSILTISTGGSAGREGPTAQISAGFGSIAADLLKMSPRDRRLAIATGIGAGIGTIFMAPLGGAILAAEILYKRDFESDAIIPAFLASIIGYSIFGSFRGFDPVFSTEDIFWNVQQIPFFLLLGVVCAAIGIVYIWAFYRTTTIFTDLFSRYHIPPHFKPMAGAFLVGLTVIALAYSSPQGLLLGLGSMGTGYGFVQLGIYAMMPLSVLLLLPFVKILTTSLTIGSGGSGGVFAPGLVVGGALGGALGTILHLLLPDLVPLASVPAFVVVGMIALFGAVSNAPIAVMIMVVEMTGNFSLLIPAMGAVAISAVLTGDRSIYREQVKTKAHSRAHRGEYMVEVLQDITAGKVMVRKEEIISVLPDEPYSKVISLIDKTLHTGFPVIENGKLLGIVSINDIRQVKKDNGKSLVRECMTRKVIAITPGQNLEEALTTMINHDIHHLPVVDPQSRDIMVGYITTTDIMKAYSRRMQEISR